MYRDGLTESQYFERNPFKYYQEVSAPSKKAKLTSRQIVCTFDTYTKELVAQLLSPRGGGYMQMITFPHAYFDYDKDDPHPKKEVLVLF